MSRERYAIYYAPEPGSALERLGRTWLRPDPGAPPPPGFTLQERLGLAARAALYGFHATLKAPFRLSPDTSHPALDRALSEFARNRAPALGPRLVLRSLDGFLALVPEGPCPEIDELAWACVRAFDRFRAAPESGETERRRRGVSLRQNELLERWGYPFVADQYRFHMTLTGRIPDLEQRRLVARRLAELSAPACLAPLAVREICLFVQPEPDAPFRLLSSHALRGGLKVVDVYRARSLT